VALGPVRAAIVAVGKAMNITGFECVFVALGIQQAERMHISAVLSTVTCLVQPYFSTIFHKTARFSGKKSYCKHCALILCTCVCETVIL